MGGSGSDVPRPESINLTVVFLREKARLALPDLGGFSPAHVLNKRAVECTATRMPLRPQSRDAAQRLMDLDEHGSPTSYAIRPIGRTARRPW